MLHTPIVSTFIQYQSSRAVSHRPCTRVATVHVVVLSALRKGQLHIVNTMLAAATKTLLAPSSFAARSMRASYARPVQQRQTVAASSSSSGTQQAEVQHMSVQELQELLANPVMCEEVQFIDVREPGEHQVARLPHFKLMPLSEASSWAPTVDQDLDTQAETVVLCHHGVRSMNAAMYLVSKGFTNVKNVTGGIAAYSRIDGSVPDY